MVAIVLAYSLWQVFFGERLLVNGGLGWDGRVYGAMAFDLPRYLAEIGVNEYRVRRLLPPALVYLANLVVGAPGDAQGIVRSFAVMNALFLAGTAWLYAKTTLALELGRRATWLGFLCLFLNFGVARQVLFSPVTTDAVALFLSMLSTYA